MTIQILVVDDSEDELEVLQSFFSDYGAAVFTASNVHDALDMLKSITPDAIISDMNFEELSGIDIVRTIRRDPLTKHIPVIITTGYGMEHAKECIMSGATGYFLKPINPIQLFAFIESVLAGGSPQSTEQYNFVQTEPTASLSREHLFDKPTTFLPALLETPENRWDSRLSVFLSSNDQQAQGRAVIALAAWQKEENAPYNTTEGQKNFWGHIRHTLASATAEDAIASRSKLAPLALALMQPVEKLTEALAAVMENECLECQRWALRILLENRQSSAAEFASQELKSEDGEMRGIAAMTLAQMGTAQHIPLLTQALNDPEPGVRENVAAALARIGGEAGTMALTAALEDGSPEAAEAAANALSKIGGEEAIEVLVATATSRTDPGLIRQVALALGRIDDERCREALQALTEHADDKVRRTAKGLLEK